MIYLITSSLFVAYMIIGIIVAVMVSLWLGKPSEDDRNVVLLVIAIWPVVIIILPVVIIIVILDRLIGLLAMFPYRLVRYLNEKIRASL